MQHARLQKYSKGEITTAVVKDRLVQVLVELVEAHQVCLP